MNEIAFPYPVLGNGDDYTASSFQTVVDVDLEDLGGSQEIKIKYSFNLNNRDILGLISDRKASFALEVECRDCFYREVLAVEKQGAYSLSASTLFGRLAIRPTVVALQPIKTFTSDDLHPEFVARTFEISPGDRLAVDQENVWNIDFVHLNFESMLKITTSRDLDPYQYGFDPSADILTINMGEKFREVWNENYQQKDKAPFLAMSVYKDCLVAALEALAHSSEVEDIGQYRWARTLMAKLEELKIRIPEDADFDQFNQVAQSLIKDLGVKRVIRQ